MYGYVSSLEGKPWSTWWISEWNPQFVVFILGLSPETAQHFGTWKSMVQIQMKFPFWQSVSFGERKKSTSSPGFLAPWRSAEKGPKKRKTNHKTKVNPQAPFICLRLFYALLDLGSRSLIVSTIYTYCDATFLTVTGTTTSMTWHFSLWDLKAPPMNMIFLSC